SPAPEGYQWEQTSAQIAERYGIAVDSVARFDLNTSPSPPAFAADILAGGRFVAPLSEYPPSDYRSLVEAASERFGVPPAEILVGAGADEVLDLCAKAFLRPGDVAVVPSPSYAMYPVLTEQREARVVSVPRLGADAGYAIDLAAVAEAARAASLVWLCSPNNPTALPEPDGAIARLLATLAADATADGRLAPVVVLDEAYAEFTGRSLLGSRSSYPRLVVVRTMSKAYALAGIRVGFALARREAIAAIEPYRPPGSVSVVSVSLAAAGLRDPATLEANVRRVTVERARLARELAAAGWSVGPSATNFLLVDFGSAARSAGVADALFRRGLVPRTFGPAHPLVDHLRFTVRSPEEDDRLIEAARDVEAGGR
ncbi:MAG TPA: histidinol-phosphate transaminase, partial [Candidatus Dormibacteraeota bacterium]|nr:histidinol-phosphate transaminase [Candidatus Dormibacteraeota bacterium]